MGAVNATEPVEIERRGELVSAIVDLIESAGGEVTPRAVSETLALAEAAAAPGGSLDLTPFEILRIRLNKAVARAVAPDQYRQRTIRRRLRDDVVSLLSAHGVPRGQDRLARAPRS